MDLNLLILFDTYLVTTLKNGLNLFKIKLLKVHIKVITTMLMAE